MFRQAAGMSFSLRPVASTVEGSSCRRRMSARWSLISWVRGYDRAVRDQSTSGDTPLRGLRDCTGSMRILQVYLTNGAPRGGLMGQNYDS